MEGASATFTVVATGTAPLSYQWTLNGTVIPGATSATYTISAVLTSDAGTYTVAVQNPVGSAISTGAELTVIPAAWLVQYFGTSTLSATNLDGAGNTLLYDYSNGITPVAFRFTSIAMANNYVNTGQVPAQLVVSGWPYWIAILVDDTNFANANWTAYNSSAISVNLGLTEGWHKVWVGLRGHADTTDAAVWRSKQLKLDLTPPVLVVTNPIVTTVSVPLIQLQGYSPEALQHISYDLTNAAGMLTNQDAGITEQFYSTNTWEFTTNYFDCVDVPLTNGLNIITLHATDLAGNTMTTSYSFTLDYSSRINPPVVKLYWPQDGTLVCNNNDYTWRGWADDPTATVTAQLVDSNGETSIFNGIMERNGNFWVENLPLREGANSLTLTVTDSAGKVAVTNIFVFPSAVELTIDTPSSDQLWNQFVTVTGTINDSNDYTVWVNGVKATLNGDSTWTAASVYLPGGGTAVIEARAIPNSNNGGNGAGGSGGGPVSYDNLGNPQSPAAPGAEIQLNKPVRLYVQNYQQTFGISDNCSYVDFATPGVLLDDLVSTDRYNNNHHWTEGSGGSGSMSDTGTCTGTDIGGPVYAFNSWTSQQTWPASSWPSLVAGTQTASGDYDWPIFEPNISPPLIYLEHCKIDFPINSSWTDLYDALSGTFETGNEAYRYTRTADVVYKLQTGGKGVPWRKNLWGITASATEWIPNGEGQDSVTFYPQPINPQSIIIDGMSLGSDGQMWRLYADGDTRDVTVKVPGVDYYTFNLVPQKYKLHIFANDSPLAEKSIAPQAHYCVGQKVNLQATWNPALPPDTQTSYDWCATGDYLNSWRPAIFSDGSQFPDIDPSICTNNPMPAWWYSDGQCNVVCDTISRFPNGQIVTLTRIGELSMYRPDISDFIDIPPSYAANCVDAGTLYLQLGDGNAHGDMMYEVDVFSMYRGKAGIVQLINRTASNGSIDSGSLGTHGSFWLDTSNPYGDRLFLILPGVETPVSFSDNPGVADVASVLSSTTSVSDQFVDYVVFRPTAGVESANIFVTLGIVSGGNPSWAWSASTTWFFGWSTPTYSVTRPSWPDDSNSFPSWLHTWHNR